MAGKTFGYVLGGLQVVLGAVLSFIPGGASIGVPMMISGAATIAGTALSPAPPRTKNLRDSPTYGIDHFNPRGPDARISLLYGEHVVHPVTLAESVFSVAETAAPGVDATRRQAFRWLGAIAEGTLDPLDPVKDVVVNDRDLLSAPRTENLGKGTGTKKTFEFPHRNVWLGPEEAPAVEVKVNGTVRSFLKKSATAEYSMGAATPATLDVARSSKAERILEESVRLFVRGPGYPEAEQLRRAGAWRWSLSKKRPHAVKVKFSTRPPTGYTVRITYDYLGADGLTFQQDWKGVTRIEFGTAPSNGHAIEATYRTSILTGLRIGVRRGTLDQSPMPGFGALETAGPVDSPHLVQNTAVKYSTSGRSVDDLRLLITAPQGMIHFKSDGGSVGVAAKVRIEYSRNGTDWTLLKNAAGSEFKLAAEKSTAVRWSISIREEWRRLADGGDTEAIQRIEDFTRAPYQVRVTRLDKEQSNNPLAQDSLEFTAVVEVLDEGLSYPGTALLGLEALPNDIVTGGLRVSCVARRGPLPDPRTDEHYGRRDLGSSQNAALALQDLLTSLGGAARERYGGGYFYSVDDLFLGEEGFTGAAPNTIPACTPGGLRAFADWCDEWVHRPDSDPTKPPFQGAFTVDGRKVNGERRCRLNLVLDTPQSLSEAIADIAALSYCFAVAQGARWWFPLDQDGEPVFTFVDEADPLNQNASKVNLGMDEWAKTPSHLEGQFWNREHRWERDELPYPIDGLPEGRPHNPRSVNLVGCDRETEAIRMLRHLAEQAVKSPFTASWNALPGARALEAGDIVALRTRLPYGTGSSALTLKVRILSVTTGHDDDGRLFARYAGRVMEGAIYALSAGTAKVSKSPPPEATPGGRFGTPPASGGSTRRTPVKSLRARMVG